MTKTALALVALVSASPRWQGPWGVAYPPAAPRATTAPAPTIVFLHGMWASPEQSCPAFVHAATEYGFLVCPRGNAPLGEGTMWSGTYANAAHQIEAAIAATVALGRVAIARDHGGTLIGYSNGAYFAAEVACVERGRWTSLILMSMKLDLDPQRLRTAGVRRVMLAAGDLDGARPSMVALAARLRSRDLDARFMSLGPVAHEFPADIDHRLSEALDWARAEIEAPPARD